MIIFYARCIRAEWSFIMSNKPYPYYDVPNVKTLKELIKLCEDKYADRRVFWYADNKGNTTEVKYSQYVQSVNRLGACKSLKWLQLQSFFILLLQSESRCR